MDLVSRVWPPRPFFGFLRRKERRVNCYALTRAAALACVPPWIVMLPAIREVGTRPHLHGHPDQAHAGYCQPLLQTIVADSVRPTSRFRWSRPVLCRARTFNGHVDRPSRATPALHVRRVGDAH